MLIVRADDGFVADRRYRLWSPGHLLVGGSLKDSEAVILLLQSSSPRENSCSYDRACIIDETSRENSGVEFESEVRRHEKHSVCHDDRIRTQSMLMRPSHR